MCDRVLRWRGVSEANTMKSSMRWTEMGIVKGAGKIVWVWVTKSSEGWMRTKHGGERWHIRGIFEDWEGADERKSA